MTDNLPTLTSTDLEPRGAGLDALRKVLLDLDDQRQTLADEGDYAGLAEGAQDIATLAGDLSAILRQARLDIARIVDENAGTDRQLNRVEIPGVGAVEVNGGWRRKGWQSRKLVETLVQQAIDSVPDERIVNGDGEVLDVAESETLAAVMQVLTDCLPLTGSLSWRTGEWPTEDKEGKGLKKYGIDDEDWCDREPQPRMAKIPRRQ